MNHPLTQNPTTDPVLLLRYRDRQYAADMLAVAIGKLNLFTWLAEKSRASTSEIQTQFELATRPLDVLLTLCRASGLIQTDPTSGDHSLTTLGAEHLVDSSPWFLGPYYSPIIDSPIAQGCLEVLRHDRPANWQAKEETKDWHESMMDESFAQSFTALMNSRGTAMGQALADQSSTFLADCQHLLDIAGGSGIYAATIVAKHPHLRATVMEQPPVDKIACQEIERHGLAGRIQVVAADLFSDGWPSGCDAAILSNVLHDWDFPEIHEIVKRTAKTLPHGGRLIIHETFVADDKSGPLPVAEYSVLLANITQGKCYTVAEYTDVLSQHGFDVGNYQETIADRGFMTAIKR